MSILANENTYLHMWLYINRDTCIQDTYIHSYIHTQEADIETSNALPTNIDTYLTVA